VVCGKNGKFIFVQRRGHKGTKGFRAWTRNHFSAEGDKDMGRKMIVWVFLLAVLISSCSTRQITDIKPAMTKNEVISAWGATNLVTFKQAEGMTLEIWEYHFATSASVCRVTFVQDRVVRTECAGQ
jgi:hypothetical protein